jgi:hypothetical protein
MTAPQTACPRPGNSFWCRSVRVGVFLTWE